MKLRDYVSSKLFYDDNNYEMFSIRREYVIDKLLDEKNESAGLLSVTETSFLRKRLGIFGPAKSISEIAEEWQKNPKVLEIVEYEIYQKIRKFYSLSKGKKPERMSSLEIHPNVSQLYNIGITRINNSEEFKIIKSKLGEYRLGYILRDSKREIDRNSIPNNHLGDLVHSIKGRFIEELSSRERRYIVRNNALDVILNSSSEWIVPYQNNDIVFYPHSIKDLIIALEYGFVDKTSIINILNKCNIEVEYPIVYKGNSAIMINRKDILNMAVEGLGLPKTLYSKLTSNIDSYTIFDLVTIGLNENLTEEEREFINNLIERMGLTMVDDRGNVRIIK